MLDEYFLDSDDPHSKFVLNALSELKTLDFIDSLQSMHHAVSSTDFILDDEESEFKMIFKDVSTDIFKVFVNDKSLSRNTCSFSFNHTRLVSFECNVVSGGAEVEWCALCTDKNFIFDNGDVIKYSEIKENLFQYDIVFPFARILLEFVKYV